MTTTVGVSKLASDANNIINAEVSIQTDEILQNPVSKLNEPLIYSQLFQTLGISTSTWNIGQITLNKITTPQVGISNYQFNIRFIEIGTIDTKINQFQGPQGSTGLQGLQGPIGTIGQTGPIGPAGPIGLSIASMIFSLSGVYSGITIPSFFYAPRIARNTLTLSEAILIRRYAGLSGTTRIDITVNAISIFASNTDKPQVGSVNGNYATSIKTVFNISSINVGDIVEVILEEVELYTSGPPQGPEGLSVELKFA